MDFNALNQLIQALLGASGLAFGIWKALQAKRSADRAQRAVATANERVTQAVTHSQAAGVTAETARQDVATVKQLLDALTDTRDGKDDLFAAYVRAMTLLEQTPRRIRALEQAVVWLADRLEISEEEAAAEAARHRTGPDDDASTITGRHRINTHFIPVIQEDQ